jgi:hypothetical protein
MTLAFGALRVATVRAVARRGRPINAPWRYVLKSPVLWAGVVLIAISINETVRAYVFGVGMIVLAALTLGTLLRAPRSIRGTWRCLGDPDSWRGVRERCRHHCRSAPPRPRRESRGLRYGTSTDRPMTLAW